MPAPLSVPPSTRPRPCRPAHRMHRAGDQPVAPEYPVEAFTVERIFVLPECRRLAQDAESSDGVAESPKPIRAGRPGG